MSEEILINVTPQETRVAVVENGVLQGEAEFSRMHLLYRDVRMLARAGMRRSGATCVRAGDAAQDVPISRKHMDVRERSPATEGRAGACRNRNAAPWMAGTANRGRRR
jgi:hypothetical protein